VSGHRKTESGTAASRLAGRNVRRLRRRAGRTAADVAQELTALGMPMSTQHLTRLETGRSGSGAHVAMSVDVLCGLAAVLGVEPAVLLGAPSCRVCEDDPPAGFACRTCGAQA
jgi:transcriptional regulator with XRE-family HTH domain